MQKIQKGECVFQLCRDYHISQRTITEIKNSLIHHCEDGMDIKWVMAKLLQSGGIGEMSIVNEQSTEVLGRDLVYDLDH
jgi:hypothetical protein